jgi:hypothetical protein
MRNALELSIITVPNLVIVLANSFDVLAPAEVRAISIPLKSSFGFNSLTTNFLPLNVYSYLPHRVWGILHEV